MSDQKKLVAAWCIFSINSILCILFFDARMMGLGDVTKGLVQIQQDIFGVAGNLTLADQMEIRFCMVLFTMLELGLLWATKLLSVTDLTFYLIWPYSAFLATKIKQELIFFPLYMIPPNQSPKKEIFILGFLLLLTFALGEHNGIVIVLFRLGCIICKFLGNWAKYLCGAFIVFVFLLDKNISLLFNYVPLLKVFAYTRDIANPNYSIVDTLGVFLSSLHLSVYVQTDWKYDVLFSFVFVIMLLARRSISYFLNLPAFLSVVCTMFFFTSITHAFQNARYYYFYLPVIGNVVKDQFFFVATLSVLHILVAGALHHYISPDIMHGIFYGRPP